MKLNSPNALARLLLFSSTTFIITFIISGCQSPRYRHFEKVRTGMDKHEVLETAGSPRKSMRYQGKDRWIYVYEGTPNGKQTREVHFENGKATYVGGAVETPVPAVKQDQINEEKNAAEAKKLDEEQRAHEKRMGTVRVNHNLDTDDLKLQESMTGIVDQEREKKKRAPRFVPIE